MRRNRGLQGERAQPVRLQAADAWADGSPSASTRGSALALVYATSCLACLAILVFVRYVESLQLPSGARAIVQVLGLTIDRLLHSFDVHSRGDPDTYAALAPLDRRTRTSELRKLRLRFPCVAPMAQRGDDWPMVSGQR